jgi:4a-hydroxytetrahydrobiopterin dehydratase
MNDLASKKCIPCEGGTPPMARAKALKLLGEISGWGLVDGRILKISKKYKFKNFLEALAFVNMVGEIAESEGHHPNVCFTWGKVEIALWTHAVGGLSKNDFILAAKIDKLLQEHERSAAK